MKHKFRTISLIFLFIISSPVIFSSHPQHPTTISVQNSENLSTPQPKLSYSVSELWESALGQYGDYSNVIISENGQYIAVSHQTNITVLHQSSNISLWSFDTFQEIKCIALSGDGTHLAVGTGTGEIGGPGCIYLFITTSNIPIWSLDTDHNVMGITISYNGFYIAAIEYDSGSVEPYLYYFNNTSPNPMWEYVLASGFNNYKHCAMSTDGKYLALRLNDESIYFINCMSKTIEWTCDMTPYAGNTYEISMSSSGDKFAVNFNGEKVFLFNKTIITPKLPEWVFDEYQTIDDIELSSDGKHLVVSTDPVNYSVYYFDTSTSIPLWRYNTSSSVDTHPIAMSGRGEYIISKYSPDVNICLLNNTIEVNQIIWIGPPLGTALKKVAMSGDGRYFLAMNTSIFNQIYIYLFYHDIPFISGGGVDENDSNGDDEKIVAIPFGIYFLGFMALAIISLVILKKRTFNSNYI
jgi:WD40 repeat protein